MPLQTTDYFLLNDFYTIASATKTDVNVLQFTIELNENHDIFKGHFEQMPVVPGVCQTQLIKELLQQTLDKPLVLAKGSNIKFTGMIIPTKNSIIHIEITYKQENESYIVDAKLFFEDITFTKFKGVFAS